MMSCCSRLSMETMDSEPKLTRQRPKQQQDVGWKYGRCIKGRCYQPQHLLQTVSGVLECLAHRLRCMRINMASSAFNNLFGCGVRLSASLIARASRLMNTRQTDLTLATIPGASPAHSSAPSAPHSSRLNVEDRDRRKQGLGRGRLRRRRRYVFQRRQSREYFYLVLPSLVVSAAPSRAVMS
ncbi:hypothetical protein CPB85DRAFT_1282162 [Mucidula mucida]|nr:hypothetical protein CPB85DRAFT_1282162 [Mucidula mucida]